MKTSITSLSSFRQSIPSFPDRTGRSWKEAPSQRRHKQSQRGTLPTSTSTSTFSLSSLISHQSHLSLRPFWSFCPRTYLCIYTSSFGCQNSSTTFHQPTPRAKGALWGFRQQKPSGTSELQAAAISLHDAADTPVHAAVLATASDT